MDWWREAGVDLQFLDETHPWITNEAPAGQEAAKAGPRPAAPTPEPEPPAPPPVLAQRESWPQKLEDFASWWMTEPALDQGGAHPRVPPRGSAHAELMVLVAEPEASDRDELLSGPLGAFLDSMLAAMGIAAERTYRAAVLPRHTPLADWDAVARSGMGEAVLHHIGLAAPERLVVFGRNILPLLGHDPAQSPANLQNIDHQGKSIPVIAGWDLAALVARPKAQSAFWQRWLDWTDSPL